MSFGFVEHFSDSRDLVKRHVAIAREGGTVLILVPNHAGLNGKILKYADRAKYALHNCMSLDDLVRACEGVPEAELVFSGHLGKAGFWNTGIYPRIRSLPSPVAKLIRPPPLRVWEIIAQKLVPNNAITSPESVVILRKRSGVNEHES